MRCLNCGSEIEPGKMSCSNCGMMFNGNMVNQSQNIPPISPNDQNINQVQNNFSFNQNISNNNGNKSKTVKLIIPVLIFISIIGLCIFLSMQGNGNNNNGTDNGGNNNNSDAVTTYIQNTRKVSFIDTASAYIDSVRTKVNEGRNLQFFTTETMFLVPVGHESGKTCVFIDSGGQSPFSDTWNYAFVGVVYTGTNYKYYFIGEDGSNYGLGLIDQNTLVKNGFDLIYNSYNDSNASKYNITKTASDNLKKMYNVKENNIYSNYEGQQYLDGIESIITNSDSNINKTVVISASNGCEYR